MVGIARRGRSARAQQDGASVPGVRRWPGPAGRSLAWDRALALLHPVRMLTALVGTAAVLASSGIVSALAWRLGLPVHFVPAILGGLLAFNTLLFFPPGALAAHPRRLAAVLAANVLPMPLAVLLYRADPVLADAALLAATAASVWLRPRGEPAGLLALIVALNVLIALVLGAGAYLVPLAAGAGAVASLIAFAADRLAAWLLRRYAPVSGPALLAAALAALFADLAESWTANAAWPAGRFAAHARRVQALSADLLLAPAPAALPPLWQGTAALPRNLVEALSRYAGELHRDRGRLPPRLDKAVTETLAKLAASARAGSPGAARAAVEELRAAACAQPAGLEGVADASRLLGLALLLSDLLETGAPVAAPEAGASTAAASAPPAPALSASIGRVQARLVLQTVACVAAALVAMRLLPLPKPYWVPLTAFILASNSFGETARKSVERILGTAAGLLCGELLWLALGPQARLLQAIIVASLFGILFARGGAYRVLLFWLTLMISVVLHMTGAPTGFYVARVADTLVGVGIVLVVAGLLLPVHADAAARGRIAELLEATGLRLRATASALRRPGMHGRDLALGPVAGAAGELQTLTEAEKLEAGLLHRPSAQLRRRAAAADRLVRCLVYIDQLAPLLPGRVATAETVALFEVSAEALDAAARRLGAGEAGSVAVPWARIAAQKHALSLACGGGAIAVPQLHVEGRLLHSLAVLLDTASVLAASAQAGGVASRRPSVAGQGAALDAPALKPLEPAH